MCTHVHTHTKTEYQVQVPPMSPCSYRSFSLFSDFFHHHQQDPVNSSMQNLKAFYYMSQYRFECNKDYNYWAFMRSNIFPMVHASLAVHKQVWILILRLLPASLGASSVTEMKKLWAGPGQPALLSIRDPWRSVWVWQGIWKWKWWSSGVGLNIRPQRKEVWKAQPSTHDCAS